MYAETGFMYPNYLNFSQEIQLFDDLCFSPKPSSSMDSIIPTSTISDYDLGGEGDLFKAPEPIVEDPIIHLDPITAAAMSLIACGDDAMSTPDFKFCGMDSLQSEQLLSDVFDGCRKELLEKGSIETEVSDALDIKLPTLITNEVMIDQNKPFSDLPLTRSGSSGSLTSMDLVQSETVRPNFLDFPDLDLESAYGMRRAFSEGDIKNLDNDKLSLVHSLQRPLVIGHCTTEERLLKLSRYRNKKARRNFGRKIKYACRKALADSQPRIRGRFAKTDETTSCKTHA